VALFGEPDEERDRYLEYQVSGREGMRCLLHPLALQHMVSSGEDEEGDLFFYNEMAGRLRIKLPCRP